MNFLDYVTNNVEYECINITILDGNVMKISLIITEVNYGDIDDNDSACHGYNIIRLYSYTYILQADLNIDLSSHFF